METQEMETSCTSVSAIADDINSRRIDCLLDLDWENLTDSFQPAGLIRLTRRITDMEARAVAVRSCLAQYEIHLIESDYDFYIHSWNSRCQFRELCEQLISNIEHSEHYRVSCRRPGDVAVPEEFCTPYAQQLFSRLTPSYCDADRRWKKGIGVTFISQVAHVMGGLLGIPSRRKWVYFERVWNVSGLARAYCQREGRSLDVEVRRLFPEYEGF